MHILVIGEEYNLSECRQKFGAGHTYFHERSQPEAKKFFEQSEVVFDFVIDKHPAQMEMYRDHLAAPLFLNTAKIRLISLIGGISSTPRFGFVGLATFLNREVLEVSLPKGMALSDHNEHREKLRDLCHQLNTDFQVVEDCVGLVTPRVICMVINEAYYTMEEGTASREDIDLAMKLGTNYPYGPFEWCRKIGVQDVYELLAAVYEDSRNERYRICPLLKEEYMAAKG